MNRRDARNLGLAFLYIGLAGLVDWPVMSVVAAIGIIIGWLTPPVKP